MNEPFAHILTAGAHANSLGRAAEVVQVVLQDKSRLPELYACLIDADAWVRMRAADSLEKVCRVRPEWLEPYVDAFAAELATSTQPSILWHLAQMYAEITLTDSQKQAAITWLQALLSTPNSDWIVAANAMQTLVHFVHQGALPADEAKRYLQVQQGHASKAVVRRADKLLARL